MYPNPFRSVPAFTLLLGAGGVGVIDESGGKSGDRAGEGVNGVEKGCAAEVEVAGRGSLVEGGRFWVRLAMVEEKCRIEGPRGIDESARRRAHREQIMLGVRTRRTKD